MRTFWLTGGALLCFASNSLLCRSALEAGALDPATFTSLRLASGAAILAVLSRRSLRPAGNFWIPGLALFAYASAFSFAYVAMAASTGALLLFAAVQATMIVGAAVRGERTGSRGGVGLLIASMGVVYLLSPGMAAPPLIPALLMIASGAAWGVYSLQGRGSGEPLSRTAGSFVVAAPLSLALSAFTMEDARLSLAGVALALGSGAFASAFGYVLWHHALKELTPSGAAAVQLAVPLLTVLGGFVFLSETPSLRLLEAALLVLGGIAITATARDRYGSRGERAVGSEQTG